MSGWQGSEESTKQIKNTIINLSGNKFSTVVSGLVQLIKSPTYLVSPCCPTQTLLSIVRMILLSYRMLVQLDKLPMRTPLVQSMYMALINRGFDKRQNFSLPNLGNWHFSSTCLKLFRTSPNDV